MGYMKSRFSSHLLLRLMFMMHTEDIEIRSISSRKSQKQNSGAFSREIELLQGANLTVVRHIMEPTY